MEAFAPNVEDATRWAQHLPTADLRNAVSLLREAVGELNRVPLAPATRQHILEALNPTLQSLLQQLTRLFLNQPLVLPETSRQLAELTESLLSLVSTGYTLVAIHTIQRVGGEQPAHPARLACEALQRAIQFAGQRMLQTFQLYQHLEPQSWLTLHQLYALGERQQLAKLPVQDLQGRTTTLTGAWLRVALLGCCQPNQLRQSDLTGIYRALQDAWGQLLRLGSERGEGADQFVVDLHSDQPPHYSRGEARGIELRYIDTAGLMAELKKLREQERQGRGHRSPLLALGLPGSILDHLINALSPPSQRNFSRRPGEASKLEVTVGLSGAHFHCAGERTFSEFLPADGPGDDSPFSAPPPSASASAQERFAVYRAEIMNASPGGYCLSWTDPTPVNLRSGDILGIRETGQVEWVVATVRWISAMEAASTLVGLELLSPRAMPYGARVMGAGGELSRPMRVLLLPEIKLVGKPHTLITPRTGFRERQRVVLLGDGEEFLVQLLRQVSASGSYSQFDFRYIRELEKSTSAVAEEITMPKSTFDSLWSQI